MAESPERPASMITVYISIGNSDDKLTQQEWSDYLTEVGYSIRGRAAQVHGEWFSGPRSQCQNACWCIETNPEQAESLRFSLALHAKSFRQDSIAWAEAITAFIAPAGVSPVQGEDHG